ncbi:MAG TPA: transketolase family protein [Sedimentibacter sp.]|jgi:transketolase|nr:transketolase family protein [Bacillota bacterium]HQC69733.1 transketolase family protein [Sedimentibacter sp.]HQK54290.1 transketolase family protein [Sedimentibacter sp.]HQO70329.1 transketolase family protein [Clostridia bacterium]
MKALRDGFGDEIVNIGKENKNIYVVDCDIGKSCKTQPFAKEFPEQYINVGIAEQNAAGVGAGLATCGKIPFVCTYAVFGSMRMCEQIRQEICYPMLNVKIACSHGGLTPANDGASHQCIEDLGIMRTLPNMIVIAPGDYYSTRKLVREASKIYGPVYMRFTRDPIPFVYNEDEEFEIGKAKQIKEGNDISIIASGSVLHMAVEAAEKLEAEGVSVRLLDMHTIKPLDNEAVKKALEETEAILTVEDHNIYNGLGSAVCEIAAELGKGRVKRMGVQDQFGESGPYYKLLEQNGVTVELIVDNVKGMLKND